MVGTYNSVHIEALVCVSPCHLPCIHCQYWSRQKYGVWGTTDRIAVVYNRQCLLYRYSVLGIEALKCPHMVYVCVCVCVCIYTV